MFAHHRRVSAAAFVLLAALGMLMPALPAGAAGTDYDLLAGWTIHDATITCPGAAPRTLTGSKAAAFIESFYPASIYGTLTEQKPPASVPVCNLVARDTISTPVVDPKTGEETFQPVRFTFKALYASQGDKAWVGLPPQEIGPGAVVPELKWYVAPPQVTKAFLGQVEPERPTTSAPATTSTKPTAAADDESSSSSAAWIIAAVAGVVLVAGAVLVRARRRGPASPPGPPAEPVDA